MKVDLDRWRFGLLCDAREPLRAQRDAGLQTGERHVEEIGRDEVGILAGWKTLRQARRRSTQHARHQHPKGNRGVEARGKNMRVDAALDFDDQPVRDLTCEREPLVFAADAGHGAVDEHEREVFRVLAAEFIQMPETVANARKGLVVAALVIAQHHPAEEPEAFVGQGEEDVVLAREVGVERCRTVFDAFSDLANRDVRVAFRNEQVTGCVQNRSLDGFVVSLLSFLDTPRARTLSYLLTAFDSQTLFYILTSFRLILDIVQAAHLPEWQALEWQALYSIRIGSVRPARHGRDAATDG
jgi:hypothetical protein